MCTVHSVSSLVKNNVCFLLLQHIYYCILLCYYCLIYLLYSFTDQMIFGILVSFQKCWPEMSVSCHLMFQCYNFSVFLSQMHCIFKKKIISGYILLSFNVLFMWSVNLVIFLCFVHFVNALMITDSEFWFNVFVFCLNVVVLSSFLWFNKYRIISYIK